MNLRIVLTFLPFLFVAFRPSYGNPAARKLFEDLLSRYNKLIRPVVATTDVLKVKFKMRLSQLLDVHEKNQIMTTNVWLEHEWVDKKLSWNPAEYGNVTVLYVPSQMIWLPDIVLYNNADGNYQVTIMTKATVSYTGQINWNPPAIYKRYSYSSSPSSKNIGFSMCHTNFSMCHINVEWFPYDEQECHMKFGTWSNDGSQVELVHKSTDTIVSHVESGVTIECVENGIDLSGYYRSTEWDILAVPGWKKREIYPCCPNPFVDITYRILLRRKTLFYSVNLMVPCVGISLLTIIVFYLPSESGEKISLAISILISLTVFFLLLVEIIPSTSTVIPLIGKYLLFTMIMVSLSISITVVVINLHFRGPFTQKISPWTRTLFLRWLPLLLLMELPNIDTVDESCPDGVAVGTEAAISSDFADFPRQHFGQVYAKTFGNDHHAYSTYKILGKAIANNQYDTSCALDECHRAEMTPMADGTYHQLSAKAKRVLANIQFISNYFYRKDTKDQIFEEWRYVAMVIDRIFLILFALIVSIGTVSIIRQAPSLYDNRIPLGSGDQYEVSQLNRQSYCTKPLPTNS